MLVSFDYQSILQIKAYNVFALCSVGLVRVCKRAFLRLFFKRAERIEPHARKEENVPIRFFDNVEIPEGTKVWKISYEDLLKLAKH